MVGADPSAGNLELAARNVPEAELLHRDKLHRDMASFPGRPIRVSGSLRDTPRRAVCGTGFEIAGENPYAHAPESNAAAPEHQLFLNCRRT